MKVAVIGTGQIAQRHLSAFQRIPEAQIVGHLGTSQAKADAAAAQWGGRGYADLGALIAGEAPDAVLITVPPHQHGPIEYQLLDSGIPFLVEKPLSADRQTAEAIANTIEQRNALVGVGYNWRAMETLPGLREQLARNPARMVIGAFLVNTPSTVWWRHQAESGGQFVEQATHVIDLARSLIGEAEVMAAHGAYYEREAYPDFDVAGVSVALLRFEGGVPGTFSATSILKRGAGVHLQLVCEGMMITVTRNGVTYDDGETTRTEPAQQDTYEIQNRAFINAVQQNDASRMFSTYADALKTHRLCQDILERSRGPA